MKGEDKVFHASEFFSESTEVTGYRDVILTQKKTWYGTKTFTQKTPIEERVYKRGFYIYFYVFGKPQSYSFSEDEVKGLVESGDWVIIETTAN